MALPPFELGLPALIPPDERESRGAHVIGARLSGPCERMHLEDGRPFRLLEVVGRGSLATVSRALLGPDDGIQRLVAAKLFAISSEEAEPVQRSLASAARRVACVHHPNVVQIYESGVWHGQPLLISELIEGVSLAALLEVYAQRKQRLPLDLALFIAVEVAEGLAAAHRARDHHGQSLGLLHHALSPRENLLSWSGEVKVSDFEMSPACAGTSSVRSVRSVATRVSSMAPEVAQGDVADTRSDIFSFGVVLRELLVAPRFIQTVSSSEAVRLACEGFVEPLTFQPHLPPELEGVMSRALEVDARDRYPNANALLSDLRPIALAMGVGDGRYFLHKTLEREWDAEGVTGQIPMVTAVGPEDEIKVFEGIESGAENVVPISRR